MANVTIIGAGNAGSAAAADLALAGADVTLYELPRFAANLQPIRERGGIELINNRVDGTGRSGLGRVRVTTDAGEACRGADILFGTTVALAQEEIARTFGPHLGSGQTLLLFTGYGGSLVVQRVLREIGAGEGVLIAEASTLPYLCRLHGPAQVEMHGKGYKAIPTAALPATRTAELLERTRPYYPMLVAAESVLEVALLNSNVTRHTVGTLMNIGRIEYSKGEFWIYREGFTPAVFRVFDALDAEKMAILKALVYQPRSFYDYRKLTIDLSLEEQAKTGAKGPSSANTRTLTEDVPMGLVFFASLGEALGVPTPTARALIHLAEVIGETDYWSSGRTLERVGLAGLDARAIRALVERGAASSQPIGA